MASSRLVCCVVLVSETHDFQPQHDTEVTKKLSRAHLQTPDEFVAEVDAGRVNDPKGLFSLGWIFIGFGLNAA